DGDLARHDARQLRGTLREVVATLAELGEARKQLRVSLRTESDRTETDLLRTQAPEQRIVVARAALAIRKQHDVPQVGLGGEHRRRTFGHSREDVRATFRLELPDLALDQLTADLADDAHPPQPLKMMVERQHADYVTDVERATRKDGCLPGHLDAGDAVALAAHALRVIHDQQQRQSRV